MFKKNKKPSFAKATAGEGKKVVKTKDKKDVIVEKPKKSFNLLRGMHDILPREEKYWRLMYQSAQDLASHFLFGRIETPVLEEIGVFVRSIGRGSDVVDKEMYVFEDKDSTKVCLRPEMTASVVRAYIMHGLWNLPQPVKLWYWGQMFRHDRPQAGRYREFHQFGFENFGSADPSSDAEMVLVAHNFFKDIGLPVEIQINSIGTIEERTAYKAELVNYYRAKRSYLCEECKNRLVKNPLRVLDCKEEQCQPVKEEAPQIVNWLGTESKNHFMKVLEYLDELNIPYQLTPNLVRGLGYYTGTVFEIYTTEGEAGQQSALGGGGRYDLLVEEMGGKSTPAIGMAIGLERVVLAWKQHNEKNNGEMRKTHTDVFVAQLGEEGRRAALRILNDLRGQDIKVAFNLTKTSLKNQLEIADGLKVPLTVIIGQKEVQDGSVIIRDMDAGVQEIVDQKKLINNLKKRLGKGV